MNRSQQIVFYDGECRFCNASVRFILDRDEAGTFHFAPRESNFAESFFEERGIAVPEVDSILLYDGTSLLVESSAVVAIAAQLPGIWSWVRFGKIVPQSWRDGLYRFVARNRYRWFGQSKACRMPSADEAERFHFDVP